MNQHNQHQAPEAAVMAYPVAGHVAPPPTPPAGYPTMEVAGCPQNSSNAMETKSKGEGFWKGCVAALCCCWVVEFCCGC